MLFFIPGICPPSLATLSFPEILSHSLKLNPNIASILNFDLASQKYLLYHFFMFPENLMHTSLCWHSACGFILSLFTSWSSIRGYKLFEDKDTSV